MSSTNIQPATVTCAPAAQLRAGCQLLVYVDGAPRVRNVASATIDRGTVVLELRDGALPGSEMMTIASHDDVVVVDSGY